ncbi:MAG: response regulator transcription factor [Elusimicrobiales bacterium]|jgi:two-component system alkaline phosphatase synthesis response regulator PhoP
MKKQILIVEDDAELAMVIKFTLAESGYDVTISDLISAGFNIFHNNHPALVIVDIDLPDGSGLDLCKKIRAHKSLGSTPIIILTGHADIDTKVLGFSSGADQYLNKPISSGELLMWVTALLKRVDLDKNGAPTGKITAGSLAIELETRLVKYKGETISTLTVREFDLLYTLVKNRPKILSRKFILSGLWDTVAVDHLVDTHIYNLRKKLPRDLAEAIQSVPGKGFRFFLSE